MRSKVYVTWHAPEGLLPPHKVTRPAQVDELYEDMRQHGWAGVPLIGYYDKENRIQLLSGTHRHAARLRQGRLVPVYVYPYSLITRCWGRLARWVALMEGRL